MEDDYDVDGDIVHCEQSTSDSIHKSSEQPSSSPSQTNVGLITFVNCNTGRNSIRSKDDRQEASERRTVFIDFFLVLYFFIVSAKYGNSAFTV